MKPIRRARTDLRLVPTVDGGKVTFAVEGTVRPKDEGHLWVTLIAYAEGVPIRVEDHGTDDGETWSLSPLADSHAAYLWVFPEAGESLASVVLP